MRTGITFGAFDPLHHGHVRLISRARELCDRLVVCVSDAEYVVAKKGREERVPFADRMASVAALRCVDEVDAQTLTQGKRELVRKHGATVIVVGDDWTPETFGGAWLGIPVVYLPRTEGMSSTQLVTGKQ